MDIDKLSGKCLSCRNPQCEKYCPLHNHISDMIREVKKRNFLKAREILDETSPFPYICSRVCSYATQCYGNCIRNHMDDPVEIYEIEKSLSNIEYRHRHGEPNGIKVAIIGGGISGLAMAKILSIKGYEVHIFERENFIGGTILTGIPSYRLDRKYIKRVTDEIEGLDVDIHLNTHYPDDIDIDKLKGMGFDRIVFAIGNTVSNTARIDGGEYATNGLDVLYDLNVLNKHDEYGEKHTAVVTGGGNVALDCARSLKRIIDNVSIVYRRSIKEMPASRAEISEALDEGVIIHELANPDKIEKTDNGYHVRCQKMRLNGVGEDGRSMFEVIEGEYLEFDTDIMVMAIGQRTAGYDDGLVRDRSNNIVVDDNYMTSISHVYAIGDCVTGASNVAQAIYHARRCIELNKW